MPPSNTILSDRPRRSALYLPASNARALEKSRSLKADVVILDLEDAVAPEAKLLARDAAAAAVRQGGFGRREVVIRVNGLDTPWGSEDLRAAASARPDAILLPKVEDPETVLKASAVIGEAGAMSALWLMMETPRAMLAATEIAGAGGRLTCFVMGSNDLLKELQAPFRPGRPALQTALGLTVLAGRANGLCLLDGVYNAIADLMGFEAECREGRDLGFDGKTLIHPTQIEPCNRVFSPDSDDVARARAIIAAFAAPEALQKGVVQIEGRMAERLHLTEARRLVALAERIASADAET